MALKSFADIIRFAIKQEETAYKLYKTAAGKAPTPASRKMFEELAAEEAGHKASFQKIGAGDVEKYAPARLADSGIADHMVDAPFREDMTGEEILRFAMKAEESAYQLYTAAAGLVTDAKLKKTLLMLTDVEKGHKVKLEAMYEENVFREH